MDAGLKRERRPTVPEVVQPNRAAAQPPRRSENPRVNRSGCSIVPSTWQNTRSWSVQPAPISSRSAACRLRCSRRAATVPRSRVTVRRPFAVLGVPSIGVCLTAMTVCRIEARPRPGQDHASAARALHRAACPVVASTRYAVQCRLCRVPSRKARGLVGCPGDRLWTACRARLRRVGRVGRIPGQPPPLHGVLECPVNDRVDVAHRTRRQPAAGVVLPPIGQQSRIQAVQRARVDTAQLHRARAAAARAAADSAHSCNGLLAGRSAQSQPAIPGKLADRLLSTLRRCQRARRPRSH